MISGKIQLFCGKYNINIGVNNKRQRSILPKTITERRICLLIHNNHFSVIWKNNQSSFPVNNNILQQVIEYKFPMSYEMNCLYNLFAVGLETCNVEYSENFEPYASGVYHPNKLYWCFNGNSDKEELAFERSKVHEINRENGNPVLKMIEYVINN